MGKLGKTEEVVTSYVEIVREIAGWSEAIGCRKGKKKVITAIESDEEGLDKGGLLAKLKLIESWIYAG